MHSLPDRLTIDLLQHRQCVSEIKAKGSRLDFHKDSKKFRFERECRRNAPLLESHLDYKARLNLFLVEWI